MPDREGKLKWRHEGKKRCGHLIKKTGKHCRAWAMKNGKCAKHGGKIKGPPLGCQNQLVHGLYARYMTQDEDAVFDAIPVGRLEDEIKVLKLRLRRALAGQEMWDEQEARAVEEEELLETMPLVQFEKEDKDVVLKDEPHRLKRRKILRRKRDFLDEILRIAGTIGRLEIRHAALMDRARETGAISTLVEELRRFDDEAAETLPKAGGDDD